MNPTNYSGPSIVELVEGAETYPVRVAVLCTYREDPVWHTVELKVTKNQLETNQHYDMAKEDAASEGFSAPMIAFDVHSDAAMNMKSILEFLS